MSSSTPNAKELFQAAQDDGILSQGSMQALVAMDIGAEIEAALGTPALEVESSEVVLVTMMIDDSGSIKYAGNEGAVIAGHNMVLEALSDKNRLSQSQIDSVLVHTCYLNGTNLFPYRSISSAVDMSGSNYNAVGGTPLFDESMVLLAKVIGKSQEFANEGVPVRTITLIVTDGNDEHSRKAEARDVAKLAKDMLMQENHIIAAMGIDDGATNFTDVFREMGILDEWILTPNNTPHDIRDAFRVFSQSAQEGSQNTQSFNAMGGFAKQP